MTVIVIFRVLNTYPIRYGCISGLKQVLRFIIQFKLMQWMNAIDFSLYR